jgi:hypothetical protein
MNSSLFRYNDHFEFEQVIGRSKNAEVRAVLPLPDAKCRGSRRTARAHARQALSTALNFRGPLSCVRSLVGSASRTGACVAVPPVSVNHFHLEKVSRANNPEKLN